MRIAIPTPDPKPTHRPLKTTFRSKGFDYEQLQRIGDVALFEQTKDGLSRIWYEVVMVQRHDGYTIGGSTVEPAETMPSSSQWGKLGWTFCDKKSAMTKFAELERIERAKAS